VLSPKGEIWKIYGFGRGNGGGLGGRGGRGGRGVIRDRTLASSRVVNQRIEPEIVSRAGSSPLI